ncbi:MAG TPA: RNA polymerase sigma factor [Allosphingosinicella sp.]|nr:RNA polymerase sigma factor [Allosphingosinicella sp.]
MAELEPESDEMLAAAAARGDGAAFEALVRRHERVVRGFLARVAGSDRADDLAQETFLTAWAKAAAFTGEGRYRGWLLRIGWTAFRMDMRGRGRRIPAYAGTGEAPEQADRGDAERDLIVEDALARLKEADRAAVVLCLVLGHSHREAAEILDMPLGTLKTRVARGSAQLLELLGDDDDPDS